VTGVLAYRLERDTKDPKITNTTKGKLTLSETAKEEGISISFRSDEHVNYFFEKHKKGRIVVMEIKKSAYDAIQEKIENPNKKVGGKSLSKPSPCSDAVMNELSMTSKDVLSFGADWADFLEANISVVSIRED
jgi:hypothetical protein